MNLEDLKVGDPVVFTPVGRWYREPKEHGIVTGFANGLVMVKYYKIKDPFIRNRRSQATSPSLLYIP